jgi:hypothetical protein
MTAAAAFVVMMIRWQQLLTDAAMMANAKTRVQWSFEVGGAVAAVFMVGPFLLCSVCLGAELRPRCVVSLFNTKRENVNVVVISLIGIETSQFYSILKSLCYACFAHA